MCSLHTVHELNPLYGGSVRLPANMIPKLLDTYQFGKGKVFPVLNYVIKHYALVASPLLTSALDGGKWSASRHCRPTPGDTAP
jgi:hypothetical protein